MPFCFLCQCFDSFIKTGCLFFYFIFQPKYRSNRPCIFCHAFYDTCLHICRKVYNRCNFTERVIGRSQTSADENHFRISLHQRRQIRIHYPDKQRADRNYEQHRRQYDCRYIFFDTTTSISFYLLSLVLANICVKKYVFSTDKKTIHNSLTFRNTLLFSMYMLFCITIGKPVCRIDQCPDLHAFF